MSDEYTPRTQDVKNCYVYAASTPDGQTVKPGQTLRREFDCWLAKYTQEAEARGAERERRRWQPVADAWTNPGRHPDFHRESQEHLIRHWPTLANAIRNAIRAGKHHEGNEGL